MADKEKEEFVVQDRRKFTSEGDLRSDVTVEETQAPIADNPQAVSPDMSPGSNAPAPDDAKMPPPPSAAEQRQQHSDYQEAGKKIDSMLDAAGAQRPPDLEITFERLVGSLYMQAMMQLGMMREENAPSQPDLISARQTIDTISLLNEKTKGNLNDREAHLLQNCLFELRMAFLEITNILTRPGGPGAPGNGPLQPKK